MHRRDVAVAVLAEGRGRLHLGRIDADTEVAVRGPVRTQFDLVVDLAEQVAVICLKRKLGRQRAVVVAHRVVPVPGGDVHHRGDRPGGIGNGDAVTLLAPVKDRLVDGRGVEGALLARPVGIGSRAAQLHAGDPRLAEQPVQVEMALDRVVLAHGPRPLDSVRVGLGVHTAQVARHADGDAKRHRIKDAPAERIRIGNRQLLAAIRRVRRHLLGNGLCVFRARVHNA